MRLRAGLGLLLLGLGGYAHLPEGVKVDLESGVVEVGSCRCKLPPLPDAAADEDRERRR